jgi:N-formylglutamate amidohydrolase
MVYCQPGLFLRYDPVTEPLPIIVDVSRSGREYPNDMRSPVSFSAIHDNVSMWLDDLYESAPQHGATLLYCTIAHMYLDMNRAETDFDPAILDGEWPVPLKPSPRALRGLGLVKTKSRYGEPVQERKLTVAEVEERLAKYHRPYHREFSRIVDSFHQRFGMCRDLSCHCMSPVGAPTHADAGSRRPDFCIGNLNGKSASSEFVELVVETLRGLRLPGDGERSVRRQRNPSALRRSGERKGQHTARDEQGSLHGYRHVQADRQLSESEGRSGPAAAGRRRRYARADQGK